jgi:hypothetical protein
MVRKSGTTLSLWLILALAIFLGGCGSDIHRTEQKRITSPGKNYDLVFLLVSGGVTFDTYSEIYVMQAGEKDLKRGKLILKVDAVYPITAKWRDDTHVTLKADYRRVFYFTNYYNDKIRFTLQ